MDFINYMYHITHFMGDLKSSVKNKEFCGSTKLCKGTVGLNDDFEIYKFINNVLCEMKIRGTKQEIE